MQIDRLNPQIAWPFLQIVIEILQIEHSAQPMPPILIVNNTFKRKTDSSFGVLNITNRNGKPANRDAYFANRRLNLQIAWPFLQIVIEILQIEQFRKADAADFKRKFTFKNSSLDF
ncbi:hypothetical protein LIS77_23165 [Cytobacillus firmus]|uniref:hypothetical protein n=1 Tax=Cytobacillus firmus TaxID=1399 RepID=UPI00207AB3AC|nr:hypothetical protein [Cytobacillus firmus]USK38747.1 hypothetical protein LIS77_23165 [Cytobacillus firmus]